MVGKRNSITPYITIVLALIPLAVVISAVIFFNFIHTGAQESIQVNAKNLMPEIGAFIKEHPQYGHVMDTREFAGPQASERQEVVTTTGVYLFILEGGSVAEIDQLDIEKNWSRIYP